MQRDLRKYLADYMEHFEKKNRGCFYTNDFYQIMEITADGGEGGVYSLILNSLMAGFMIGYRKAKRDSRKRGKQCS